MYSGWHLLEKDIAFFPAWQRFYILQECHFTYFANLGSLH